MAGSESDSQKVAAGGEPCFTQTHTAMTLPLKLIASFQAEVQSNHKVSSILKYAPFLELGKHNATAVFLLE